MKLLYISRTLRIVRIEQNSDFIVCSAEWGGEHRIYQTLYKGFLGFNGLIPKGMGGWVKELSIKFVI